MFCAIFLFAVSAFIQLGDQVLNVEIADTEEARATGLMGRKELPEGEGMLFVYEQPSMVAFYMKNTLIPLSIGFFDETKKLTQIEKMDVLHGKKLVHYFNRAPALYALEVPQGWFAKHKIQI